MSKTNISKDNESLVDALPRLGAVEDDVRDTIRETANRCIQNILDALEYRYRKDQKLSVIPSDAWEPLRAFARQHYIEISEQVIAELKPNGA